VTSGSFDVDALPRANPLLSLSQGSGGQNPSSSLVADSSGNLYGTTSAGGVNDTGTVYELSGPNHSAYTTLVSFPGPLNVDGPIGSDKNLVIDGAGNLYGTYGNSVFELSANHTTLTTLATFTGDAGSTLGSVPNGLTIDPFGNLYGTTQTGGATSFGGLGTVFEITAAHQFISLLSFTGSSGSYPGENPHGTLSIDSNGNLYGTTQFNSNGPGVATTEGTLFELAADHHTFTTLVTFTGSGGAYPGANPEGPLAIDKNGNIFGTTATTAGSQFAASAGNGTVFELAADHTTFTSLFTFTGTSGNYPGSGPADIVVDGSGNLLGATGGSVFELAADHTTFSTLQTFTQSVSNTPPDGRSVALSFDGSGNLYATTTGGGTSGKGTATEFSGAGYATVTTIHTFANGDPINFQGSMAVDRFGNLYGTTADSIFELSGSNYSTYTTCIILGRTTVIPARA
jgi:uncharacterized repeat protein (TIGR03803 family)